jgi:cobalamin-dependent methionine synthase I
MTEAQMQALLAREKKLEEDFRPILARVAAATEAHTAKRVAENKEYYGKIYAEEAARAAEVQKKHAEYAAKPKRNTRGQLPERFR